MQIVIDIPEKLYNATIKGMDADEIWDLRMAIKNGTPLPKRHGRLIDESQVTGTFTWDNGSIECFAPTIIEADKAEREDEE